MNMLDVFLSVVVLVSVILFGALLLLGNERQRKAIQAIADQAARWAEQDLSIKRARGSKDVTVEDPRAWLDRVATGIFGVSPSLTELVPWKGPGEAVAMVATCSDGRKLVVTPMPEGRFRAAVRPRRSWGRAASALANAEGSILGPNPKSVPVYELTIVTAGTFFDVEAAQAWKRLHGQDLGVDRMVLFEVPAPHAAQALDGSRIVHVWRSAFRSLTGLGARR